MFCKVCDIDWTSSVINRAGIIPICDDGKRKWIGVGVSNYSANITTLGGSYEATDHDLLSTAVREYNEEIGSNIPNVTEEVVYNYYAIVTGCDVNILLPISSRPVTFSRTPELYTMIWITPRQLLCMTNSQKFNNSNTKILSVAWGFGDLISILAQSVDSGIPFTHAPNQRPFIRPKRVLQITSGKTFTNIKDFKREAEIGWRINRQTGVVVSKHTIGLLYGENFYLLPVTDIPTVVNISNRHGITMLTSTISGESCVSRQCRSIERSCNRPGDFDNIFKQFMNDRNCIKGTDISDRIISELRLIVDYELKIYALVEKLGTFFSPRRADFLVAVEIVNYQLSKGAVSTVVLLDTLINICNYDKCESKYILDIMISTKLLIKPVKPFLIDI
jgi:8-oxo-dGTP pyrophosphatase MutT (NUDIX family)